KKQKSRRKQRKEAEVAQDETEHEESVSTPSNDPLPSSEDSMQLNDLMVLCTKLQKQVLDLEKAKSDQAIEIASLKKRVEKLERRRKFRTIRLQRLKKVGTARRVESSNDSLGAQEDASKQGRRIKDLDADAEVTLINETQERQDEDLMFDAGKAESSEEKAKGSRKKILGKKRAGKEQQQESSKRQIMEDDKETNEHKEVEADDEAELKKHLVIVKDDDIAIDDIPLATKPPVIVEYKIIKEGIIGHYQLIRADRSSKRHSSMIRMLQDIDREDLETL
ncbi:hypothetical protein Tco_1422303, partial [Tanacetum coccineum]